MNIKNLFLLALSISALLASSNTNDENANPMAPQTAQHIQTQVDYHPCLSSDNESLCRATEAVMSYFRGVREQFSVHPLNTPLAVYLWFSTNQNTQCWFKK